MKKWLQRMKGCLHPMELVMVLFGLEGALLQFISSIGGFGNNLFATNLGATDAQIGLIQTVPNVVGMALLLPLGMLADRMKSVRNMLRILLCCLAGGHLLIALVPMAGAGRMALFFVSIAFTVGGVVLYNAQWQNFFGDMIPVQRRNQVLTMRNRCVFLVAIAAPILCGVLMGKFTDAQGKLRVLQGFYLLCALVAVALLVVISRMPPEPTEKNKAQRGLSLGDMRQTVSALVHHRPFVLFFLPIMFFHVTWQLDWSMWYIGQVQYLHMTETQLSIYNGVFNIGQLIAVGFFSRLVRRRGADYAVVFAGVGLVTCPVTMMLCTLLPLSLRAAGMIVLMTVLNAPQCAAGLSLVQILLRVSPEKHRSTAVSFYTLAVTASNCVVPYLGVQLYLLLGANLRALYGFFLIMLVLRAMSTALLWWRYQYLKKHHELESTLSPQVDDAG